MTKELIPLEALEKIGNAKTKDTSFGDTIKTNLPEQYKTVETALKRLDSLNCLIDNSKKLKALEIIKKKRVDVGNFIDMLEDWKSITYEDWLNYKEENGYYLQDELNELEFGIITKEEFDLLKEVLL